MTGDRNANPRKYFAPIVAFCACIKDVWMEGGEETPENRVFRAGGIYPAWAHDAEHGYRVVDDWFDDHHIGEPGGSFFDECFKKVEL